MSTTDPLSCTRCGGPLNGGTVFCSKACFNKQRAEMRRARIIAKRLASPWIKRQPASPATSTVNPQGATASVAPATAKTTTQKKKAKN